MRSFVAGCTVTILAVAALALGLGGCGSHNRDAARPDIAAIPDIEHRAKADKMALYEFRAKVRKRGASAAKQDVGDLAETFEAYQKLKLGEHQETYKQIAEKLKALQASLAASPSKDAVVKAADEIGALADKLPGAVNANPQVE